MKAILISFCGILLFNEFLVLNYEAVTIVGFLIVLSILIKNLRPIFDEFFRTTKQEISEEINNVIDSQISLLDNLINTQKIIITKYIHNI